MHRKFSCFGNSTFETLNHKSAGKILTTVYIVQIPYILVLCGYHCHGGLLVVESVNSVVVKSCLIARNHLVEEVAICLIWFNIVGPFCGLWGFKYFERLHATEWQSLRHKYIQNINIVFYNFKHYIFNGCLCRQFLTKFQFQSRQIRTPPLN